MPIHARALAIGSDADGPAVLIAVDTTGVSDALVSEIARRLLPLGIRRERLAVTGTHTHTAPMISGVLPTLFGQPVPPEHQAHIDRYTTELTDDLEAVAREALSKRQPARLSWSIGTGGLREEPPHGRRPHRSRAAGPGREGAGRDAARRGDDLRQSRRDAVAQFHRRGLARLRRRRDRREAPGRHRARLDRLRRGSEPHLERDRRQGRRGAQPGRGARRRSRTCPRWPAETGDGSADRAGSSASTSLWRRCRRASTGSRWPRSRARSAITLRCSSQPSIAATVCR